MTTRYELAESWSELARCAISVAADAVALSDVLDLAPEDIDGAPLVPRSALLHRDRCLSELRLAVKRAELL